MKNFINIRDISSKDLRKILIDAKSRKKIRNNKNTLEADKDFPLKDKLLIQMFEKSSLRTRLSFYLAIRQLGGSAMTLRPDEIHLGRDGENISDIAKIVSVYGDAFMLRTDNEKKLSNFSNYISIPLINGLSPNSHPAQIISDIFTIEEVKKKKISNLTICWVGDCNNVLNSLVEASVKLNFLLNIVCPKKYSPKIQTIKYIKKNKAKVSIFHDANIGVRNADVIMTDKVISMNDKVNKNDKKKFFSKFRINKRLVSKAKRDCIILHCLPRGEEITDQVFHSKQSKVWQQAMNRVHVQKSLLLYCFGKLR